MPIFIFLLYRLLQVIGFPLIVLYLLWRGSKSRQWLLSIPERFGGLPFRVTAPGGIWLHAVSVGEVISAISLLKALRERLPDTPLYVSVTTTTGHALAQERLHSLCDGVFYTPLDFRFAVRRVLRSLRPTLLIVMETEIWPNLWRETKRTGAGLLVINARISDRALPKYLRYRWFFHPILAIPDAIYAQSRQDVDRYAAIGAPRERLHLGGNLKYDFDGALRPPPADLAEWIQQCNPTDTVIAASTMPGIDASDADEDDLTLDAYQQLAARRPGLLWIHVPRRPERFPLAAEKIEQRGIRFVRRSQLTGAAGLPAILLLDTLGELSSLFPLADAVFMGGTLVRRGGHNILEPAFCAKPVIAGPRMENFAEIAAEFTHAGAMVRIDSAEDLAPALDSLLGDPQRAAAIGKSAQTLAESKRGATRIAVNAALEQIENSAPQYIAPLHALLFLGPLTALWRIGARISQNRQIQRQRRLNVPVLCVGGLGAGGSGKTPTVTHLTHAFKAQGKQPGILTRGYQRVSISPFTLIEAGQPAPTSETGDEAQIFVRDGIAHIGIGSDRAEVGRRLLDAYPADVLILDDGFQHRRLHRDFDLVLLDAQDPWSNDHLLPLGRLREPAEGLARAHAVLLTRTQRGREYRRTLQRIERINPGVPVFRSRVEPGAWEPAPLPAGPYAAFCGLGTPASFWATLRQLRIETCFRWEFPDHHQYHPSELARLLEEAQHRGAKVLLTTEKDVMNLPPGFVQMLQPLALRWLTISVHIEKEAELRSIMNKALFS